jgi:type I site-specific restriction-modification system R (restriction) subunit
MPVCSDRQRKILGALLDKFEGSRTYRGTNQVSQNFSVDPVKFFPAYRSDTVSVEQVEAFEAELRQLAAAELVLLEYRDGEVKRILMDKASLTAYYKILGRLPRAKQEQQEIEWYRSQMGHKKAQDAWCDAQIQRLSQGKRGVYTIEETSEMFRALRRILDNREEILERELSIDLYGDSKRFEKGVRRKVCRLLRESGLYEDVLEGIEDERTRERVILGEHQVVPNPT